MGNTVRSFEDDLYALRDRITIDKDSLDEEITKQPQLCYDAGELLANINNERDAIKEDLERLESQIALDLRDKYDREQEKYTEKSLRSEVLLDDEYRALDRKYATYKGLSSRVAVLQSAFETKTRMLAYLARLYVSNYYSDPTVTSRESEVEEARARSGRRAASQMRKRGDR